MRPTVTSYERRCEQCGPERRSIGRKERRCDKTKAHWVIAVSAISPPPYGHGFPFADPSADAARVSWVGCAVQLVRDIHGTQYPCGQSQAGRYPLRWSDSHACRYRRTAIGAKMTIRRADQTRARARSLVDPTSTDRTASTIGVIGWYLAKGWSQPGIVLTGT